MCVACVQANALPNPRGLARSLLQYNDTQPSYIGCMKAGPVVGDWKSPWFEPQAWKFGGSGAPGADRFYMLHASANGYALTRAVALHIAHFGDVLAVRSYNVWNLSVWLQCTLYKVLAIEHISDCCASLWIAMGACWEQKLSLIHI